LEREGELKRISIAADVDLEITEITDRVSKAGGPALLFEKPRLAKNSIEYSMPILINMLGSKRRMELALEVSSLEDVARRIEDLLEMKPPEGFLDKVRMLPKLSELGSFFPKSVKSGPACFARQFTDHEVLAAGWRAFHYLPAGGHEESQERPPQRGLLSHAGVRFPDHRHALANP
jgi:UbiD family decarboxylase